MSIPIIVRQLGCVDYVPTLLAMQKFTEARTPECTDEIWLCEHPPVFTLGLAGRPEHLLQDIGIPIVQTDRGGQITYHAPGQIVAYLLLNLRHRQWGVKKLVWHIEQALITLLHTYDVRATRLAGAPGVYVAGAKIAALGLRVRNGCCYHGLALNVDIDLAAFAAINPCGYPGMVVTRLCDIQSGHTVAEVSAVLVEHLQRELL